jgi:hypothetical protein
LRQTKDVSAENAATSPPSFLSFYQKPFFTGDWQMWELLPGCLSDFWVKDSEGAWGCYIPI